MSRTSPRPVEVVRPVRGAAGAVNRDRRAPRATARSLADLRRPHRPSRGDLPRRPHVAPLRRRPPVRDAWTTLRANLTMDSTACRHALRLAVTLALATAFERVLELPRGYWVPLTAGSSSGRSFTTPLRGAPRGSPERSSAPAARRSSTTCSRPVARPDGAGARLRVGRLRPGPRQLCALHGLHHRLRGLPPDARGRPGALRRDIPRRLHSRGGAGALRVCGLADLGGQRGASRAGRHPRSAQPLRRGAAQRVSGSAARQPPAARRNPSADG